MNIKTSAIRITFALACVGFFSKVQAVVPAPDGGYPGGNTAEGQAALLGLTTGEFNTAVGFFSLRSTMTGSFNTAVGAGTLLNNTADQNTATGVGALLSNFIGAFNTANGAFALFTNNGGNLNTANGDSALFSNTMGSGNTAIGYQALNNSNTQSSLKTPFGIFGGNTAVGAHALENSTTGRGNTALGIGSGSGVTTADNVICIGTDGANVTSSCFVGNIRGVTTANADAIPVLIDSAGQLGTMSSSRRFKKEISPMDKASEAILALKPVTFHYKSDNTNRPEFGLIAEEVAEANSDLVVRDEKGEIYTVRYDAVNAMLLNEFLKAHRKVQEQEATISQLKKEMGTIVARLKEQDSKIQRVSDQMQINRPAARAVVSSH